jgi:hypothetical protein
MEWLGHAGPVLGALIAGLAVEQFGINVPEALTNLFFLMFVFALGPALVGAFKAFGWPLLGAGVIVSLVPPFITILVGRYVTRTQRRRSRSSRTSRRAESRRSAMDWPARLPTSCMPCAERYSCCSVVIELFAGVLSGRRMWSASRSDCSRSRPVWI